MTSLPLARVYIHVRFALIGRNQTIVTASHRACFRRSDRGVRREGKENLVPRVLEESEKKIKEEKRGREREGNLPSLSPLPHPLVAIVFFLLTSLFAVATAGLPVASQACDRPVNGQGAVSRKSR